MTPDNRKVNFSRIGLDRDVPPLVVPGADGGSLAHAIHTYAQTRLPGRAVQVDVRGDLTGGHLHQMVGDNLGDFTIESTADSATIAKPRPTGEPGPKLTAPMVEVLEAAASAWGNTGADLSWAGSSTKRFLMKHGLIVPADGPAALGDQFPHCNITDKGAHALELGHVPGGYSY